jgi:Protein of unknown function (DUF2911)
MRCYVLALVCCILGACYALGQNSSSDSIETITASCDFDSQNQVAVNYKAVQLGKKAKTYLGDQVPYGRIWQPGKEAMTLLTNTPLSINGTQLSPGGYTAYLIPERKQWTFIVSKNTNPTAKYDKSQDLVRAPMETGQLPSPEPEFSVYFAHTGPKECTMRVDLADVRATLSVEQR